MVKAHAAASMQKPQQRVVVLAYAALLVVASLLQLVAFEATVAFVREMTALGDTTLAAIVVIVAVSAQILSLPFLLRLTLSKLARSVSAFLTTLAPVFWLGVGIAGVFMSIRNFMAVFVIALACTAWVVALVCRRAVGLRA